MDAKEAIKKRISVNSFKNKGVSNEIIASILELAKNTPSSGDLQNWKVIIVDERDKKTKIANSCLKQRWMVQAPVYLIICNDYENVSRMYGPRGKDLYSIQNCAAFAQNILTAATSFELSSCWVGAFETEKIRGILKIPDNIRPETIIVLGYSDETKERVKKGIDKFTFFNEYGSNIRMKPPAKAMMEGVMAVKEKGEGIFSKIFGRFKRKNE